MHGRFYLCFLFVLCFAVGAAAIGHAETPAPSVHWGALAYPDQERTLMAGLTLNRFTEFNNSGQPYDSTVHQTIGFNFASLTWTERFNAWATNLTVGAGPTSDQPTRYLQNNFAHRLFHFKPVPVGAAREASVETSGRELASYVVVVMPPSGATCRVTLPLGSNS